MAKKTAGLTIKVNPGTANRMHQVWERRIRPAVAQEILQNCNEFCPMDTGTLANSGHVEDGGKYIVWDTKYAAAVYYTGKNIRRVKNPNASARWAEVAKRKYKKHWASLANKIARKR